MIVLFLFPFVDPPTIIEKPDNMTVVSGINISFSCLVCSGEPQHNTEWLFNNVTIYSNSKYDITEGFNHSSTLSISDVVLDDAGEYSCIASNVHGRDEAIATLSVQGFIILSLSLPVQYNSLYFRSL